MRQLKLKEWHFEKDILKKTLLTQIFKKGFHHTKRHIIFSNQMYTLYSNSLRGIPTRRPGRRPTGLPADRRSVSGAIDGRRSAVSRRATGFCAYPHKPVYRRSDADRRAIGIRSAVNRFDCVCACFAERRRPKWTTT